MKFFIEKFKYIIMLLFLTIIFASYTSFLNTKDVIKDKYRHQKEIAEKSILQAITHINNSYKIAEHQLNQEMERYSMVLRDKYKQNPNIMDWDLEALKQNFADYEIYIINKDLKIIKTTFEKDLGLDFSKYSGFAQVLRERLSGDSFVVDRLDLSTRGGEIKKYSYLPTHDNQYLLELSIEVQKRFPVLQSLDIFADATEITEKHELVEEISFYSVEPLHHGVAKLRSSKGLDPNMPEIEEELARKSILNNKVQSKIIYSDDHAYLYKFFPALISGNDNHEQWNSYVVAIKYNDRIIVEEISKHRLLFLITTSIMLLVFILFIIVVVYLLKKFEYQATHDQLTGLVNRKLFTTEFEKLVLEAQRNKEKIAVLFLDIDKFKVINDNFGHDTGDKILKEIAKRLNQILDKDALICRPGGDEFAITLRGFTSQEELTQEVDIMIENFNQPLILGESKFFISFSLGISIYPDHSSNLEELLKKADYAMYIAKRRQKDYSLYNEIHS